MSDPSGLPQEAPMGEFPCPNCRKADGVHARGCLTLLAEELDEMERTDPAVAAAAASYDVMRHEIVGRSAVADELRAEINAVVKLREAVLGVSREAVHYRDGELDGLRRALAIATRGCER